MNKKKIVELLIEDLKNEYNHMLFYLAASFYVKGYHRAELSEFFAKEAADEMKHVQEFSRLIIDLGGNPTFDSLSFPDLTKLDSVENILTHVLNMEEEVVNRYVQRLEDAVTLSGVDGKYIEIFLENQILDSRTTAADVKEMLK